MRVNVEGDPDNTAWLAGLDKSRVREVYLMHLSDACGNEWMFRRLVQQVVGDRVQVTVCPRERLEDVK